MSLNKSFKRCLNQSFKNCLNKSFKCQFNLTCRFNVVSVTEAERRRLQDAFRRLSAPSGWVNRQLFVRDILGDGVPCSIAERIFGLCGGGTGSSGSIINSNGSSSGSSGFSMGTQSRGLSFRDTLTVLVLLTRGTSEEKTKCKTRKTVFVLYIDLASQINQS